MTGHSNFVFFCMVSPISTRLFCYITCTFKCLLLFIFEISQFVPFFHIFDRFCGFKIKKGTHCEVLNLNKRILVRLKVHIKKKSRTDWGNPTKNLNFKWPVTLKIWSTIVHIFFNVLTPKTNSTEHSSRYFASGCN